MSRDCRRFFWFIMLVLLVAAIPLTAFGARADKPLPAFMLEEIGARKYIPIEQTYTGKPALFFLMTVNSTTCRGKLAVLEPLAREFAGKVSFVLISVDEDGGQAVARLTEIDPLHFVFLSDPFFRFGKYYEFTYTPVTLLTNAEGKVVLAQDGFNPEDAVALRMAIETLVK